MMRNHALNFAQIAELARKHGVDPSYISHIRAGRRGRHIQ